MLRSLLIAAAAFGAGLAVQRSWPHGKAHTGQCKELQELDQREPGNAPWIDDYHERTVAREEKLASTNYAGEETTTWASELASRTPRAFQVAASQGQEMWTHKVVEDVQKRPSTDSRLDCHDPKDVVVPKQLLRTPVSNSTYDHIQDVLTECGFVYLDNFFSPEKLKRIHDAYVSFRSTPESDDFRYPCQGRDRVEHMLPFAPPFNTSRHHMDSRLMEILRRFLGEPFKMELQTVITSKPGAGDQRWHQGWRYLFHPEEQLPPFAAVVTVPLVDVSPEMGPTEICPRRKLRFYHGFRCPDGVSAGTTMGTVIIFDYKTLHRGPGNAALTERPMISMVYSKAWFVNVEAFVNRGISLIQTLHQRRWWESFFWHPEQRHDFWKV